nr:hypothetical protein [Vulcanisaeta sp. JCM 14467]
MGEFSNKVVLVTGGTRGIGRAIARHSLKRAPGLRLPTLVGMIRRGNSRRWAY